MLNPLGAMTLWLPEAALTPDHAPEAAQLVAPVEVQVRVDEAPVLTLKGLALMESVAAWAAVTQNNSAMPASIQCRRINNWGVLAGVRFDLASNYRQGRETGSRIKPVIACLAICHVYPKIIPNIYVACKNESLIVIQMQHLACIKPNECLRPLDSANINSISLGSGCTKEI